MLQPVPVGHKSLADYTHLAGRPLTAEIRELAEALEGLTVLHLSATAFGGGVAEILYTLIPLMRDVGIEAEWQVMLGREEFYNATKRLHNALQGSPDALRDEEWKIYERYNALNASEISGGWDVIIVHDPQPAGNRRHVPDKAGTWIWRCHIDSSEPNADVWAFLRPFIQEYDVVVFTLADFMPPDLQVDRVAFIAPVIDPLSTKNMDLPQEVCRRAMADSGLDLDRPILLQVSRFDPWKDPLGVIRVYRLVKEQMPGVQLVLIGAMAGDDPEGWNLLNTMNQEAVHDPDLYIFTNLTGVGNMEVNAFQRGADLVIQKSLKEGFGLVVSEAFWKGKAVVAGNAGGIPMQFPPEFRQFLVQSAEECAEKVLALIRQPGARAAFGRAGRERVRQKFLLPRLVRDELALIQEALNTESTADVHGR